MTATEVGETFGCAAETARRKLLALRDRDVVTRRQVGAGAVVWRLTDDAPPLEDATEGIDPDGPRFSGDALLAPEDPNETEFDATCEQFVQYDDHELSFTDCMSGILATERDVERVFTSDADHVRTLGFTTILDGTDT